jgi:putative solute:sodium symporter small subunit
MPRARAVHIQGAAAGEGYRPPHQYSTTNSRWEEILVTTETAKSALDLASREAHWDKTRNLMIGHLIVWFIFAYVIHLFAGPLNNFSFFGWPLGYYFAAQGSLIVFVVQLFVFNRQQHALDLEYGVAEDEED